MTGREVEIVPMPKVYPMISSQSALVIESSQSSLDLEKVTPLLTESHSLMSLKSHFLMKDPARVEVGKFRSI